MPVFLTVLFSVLGGATLIFLLWLLAAAPGNRRPETDLFKEILYAHRGLHDLSRGIAENSIPAFALAAERGFGIELDVQLSADGIPMVFHDATLDRVCGVPGRLSEKTSAELRSLTLFGIAGTHIPTLAEVLSLVDGRVPLLVEIKEHPSPKASAAAAAKLLDDYNGPYIVEAFHPFALQWFSKNRPGVIRGQLSAAFLRDPKTRGVSYAILHFFLLNFLSRPDFIAFDLHHRNALSISVLRAFFGVPLFGWTAKTEEEYAVQGFDTLIFEGDVPEKPKGITYEN